MREARLHLTRREFSLGAAGAVLTLSPSTVASAANPDGGTYMGKIESKLAQMGLQLPEPLQMPAGIKMPFSWVRVRGKRAYISGHVPTNMDGSLAQPLGKVGTDVTPEEGYNAARLVALAHLGSLKRALGDLDRVTAWLRVFAMVNVAPDFSQTPLVTNGYSDLINELYGAEAGAHARSSIGMMIPLNAPVNCEAEVEIDGG